MYTTELREILRVLTRERVLCIPENFIPRNSEVKIYCAKGESGKFYIKIALASLPFAQRIKYAEIRHTDRRGRLRMPKWMVEKAGLSSGGWVLLIRAQYSILRAWSLKNQVGEWRAELNRAGIETTFS